MSATRPRWIWAVPPALAVLVLAPLLTGRGFGLVGDMVFVPVQPWKDAWTGSDGGVPRAVPSDAWVSLATQVVPGDLVQKAVLLLVLAGSGWGVLRLLRDLPPAAALAGAVLFEWNPYVHERLGIGHWALLCGYAALPWCALGARRVRDRGWRALASIALPAAVAGWSSPSGGVMAALVVMGVLRGRPREAADRRRLGGRGRCGAGDGEPGLAASGSPQRSRSVGRLRRGGGLRGASRHAVRAGRVAADPRGTLEGEHRPARALLGGARRPRSGADLRRAGRPRVRVAARRRRPGPARGTGGSRGADPRAGLVAVLGGRPAGHGVVDHRRARGWAGAGRPEVGRPLRSAARRGLR